MQEEFGFLRSVRVQPCIRPVFAWRRCEHSTTRKQAGKLGGGSDRGSGNEYAEQSPIKPAWTKGQDHAAQKLPLGGSGDLRLFNPLALLAGGSSYEIARYPNESAQ